MKAIQHLQLMVDSGHYKESDGPNRSPSIDAMCNEFGVPLGSSWCALFASEGFKRSLADGESGVEFHYTAGSQDLLAWFRSRGWVSANANDILQWKGAIIIRTDPGGLHGHVGTVKERLTDAAGNVVAVATLEGNTDVNGGSNGDGAYERHRPIPLEPYTWHFCDTSAIAGGDWWT